MNESTLYVVRNGVVSTLDRVTPDGEKYEALVRTSLAEDVANVALSQHDADIARNAAPEWLRPYTDNLLAATKVVVAVDYALHGDDGVNVRAFKSAAWYARLTKKVDSLRPGKVEPAKSSTAKAQPATVDKHAAALAADAVTLPRGTSAWWTAYRADTAAQREALAKVAAPTTRVVRSSRKR